MSRWRGAVGGGLGLALSVVVATAARSPEAGLAWRVVFVAAALAGCGLVWWGHTWWTPSTRALLLWAVGLRLLFLPILPGLSDDGYRYLWDGLMQREGLSPYAYPPSDEALSAWQGSVLFERMNSPGYYSVYPPVSQFGFRIAASVLPLGWTWAWYGWKVLVLLAEAVGIWALIRWAGSRRTLLYALNPVVLIEVAGQAHTEGLLIGAFGLIALSGFGRTAWGGVGVAAAVWVKLWPVAWLPTLVQRRGGRGRAAALVLLFGFSLYAGLPQHLSHLVQSLTLYTGVFDFYSAPYRVLKMALYPVVGEAAGRWAASGLTLFWGGVCVAVWAQTPKTWQGALRVVTVTTIGYALTSSTMHPWHWLGVIWLMPLLHKQFGLFWLCSLSTSTYIIYTWPGAEAWSLWIGWGGAAALLLYGTRSRLLQAVMSRRADMKEEKLRPVLESLSAGAKVLDLGAGEGYVGRAVGNRRGVAVEALDVVDLTRALGPRVDRYDGITIPMRDSRYEAVLIVYVLHHARAPRQLLREAIRVARGPVVILETVCYGPRSKRWLEWLDRIVNRLRSGGRMDEDVLTIRTDAEWRQIFDEDELHLQHHQLWHGLHPQALYVLSGHSASRKTSSTVAELASMATASG